MYKKNIFIFILFTFVACISCNQSNTFNNPVAVNGVLDLRSQGESIHQVLALDGEWEFYWNSLIEPSQFAKDIKPHAYIKVPGAWNKQKNFKNAFPAFGYATYRLRIIHDTRDIGNIKTLMMPYVHSAYTLWVNGKIASRNGRVGTSDATMTPFQLPLIAQFIVDSPTTELVLHISNFQQRTGGILRSIKYGNYDIIIKQYELKIFITLFVTAALLVILLYHIGLFIFNKGYTTNLYFAFYCAVIGLRLLLIDEKLFVKYVSSLPWDMYLRMEYCTILLGIISFAQFIKGLYPKNINRKVLYSINIYFAFSFFLYALSPYQSFLSPYILYK